MRSWLAWLLCFAAGATLGVSVTGRSADAFAMPAMPVQGEKLDAKVEVADAAPGSTEDDEPILIDGAPFLDFGSFLFQDYDAPALRDPPNVALAIDAFPEPVRERHGQQVAVEGYVLAAEMKDGVISNLILTRFPPGCCFGSVPVLDEWISVDVEDGGNEPFSTYLPVVAIGELDVGEDIDDTGEVKSLYRMKSARILVEEQ